MRWQSAAVVNVRKCAFFLTFALGFIAFSPAVRAEASQSQQHLYDAMIRQPTNYQITIEYVRVASENGDYEAAIGALERLLYYNPSLGRIKYELGTLYYRLRAYEMARRYFLDAQSSRDIDAQTRSNIDGYLAEVDQQTKTSRFAGFVQTGLRYQSNGNLAPTDTFIRFGGLDVPSNTSKHADTNAFALVGLNHDWDLGTQNGDVLETRFAGYLTDQFRFHDFDVGLAELSIGPRIPLGMIFPGASIKPYVVGGQTWVGGAKYVSGAGGGVATQFALGPNINVGPGFEWRHVDFNLNEDTPTSVYNTGDWSTISLAASTLIGRTRIEARAYYRRGTADFDFQAFKQWVGETAVTFDITSMAPSMWRSASLSPYLRYIRTEFNEPDPFIDPTTAREDDQWVFGAKFDTTFTKVFGLSATVQYDRTKSSLPNYSQENVSVLIGPTARF